jgi:hypothetical protein
MRIVLAVSMLGIASLMAPRASAQSTYDVAVAGMSCKQQTSGQLDCNYAVGRSLRFAIAGVGEGDAAITFYKVDFDGDYYASVGTLHGCVIVKPAQPDPRQGPPSFAFVSPKDGKVYRDWQTCQRVTRAPNR